MTNGRITAFVSANNVYCSFIPIYCAGLLYSDKRNRTDIEIITNLSKLPKNTEKALDYLRKIYNCSKIIIHYRAYQIENGTAIVNGKKVKRNSVRFIIEPLIKNEYIFIGDIDIIYLVENYYDNYLMDMFNRTSCYSNIVRQSNRKKLTGVHFSKWYCFYPFIFDKKINLMITDEALLFQRLKELGIQIDFKTRYRPIFGVHMSVNRKKVEDKITNLTWEAAGKRELWKKFINTETYKFIYPLLDINIVRRIKLLEKYYLNHV